MALQSVCSSVFYPKIKSSNRRSLSKQFCPASGVISARSQRFLSNYAGKSSATSLKWVHNDFPPFRFNRGARVSASISDLGKSFAQKSEFENVSGRGNDGFEPFRGKPGSISFYGITHQSVEEGKLESSPFKPRTGSYLWTAAPLVLLMSLILPPLLVGGVVNIMISDVVIAEIVASLSSEAAFYAGLASFLIITDRVQRPYLQYSAKRWSLITGLKGYLSSAFFTMGLKIIAPLFAVYVAWPELGMEGLVTVAPFLAGCFAQFIFEISVKFRGSSCWPLLHIHGQSNLYLYLYLSYYSPLSTKIPSESPLMLFKMAGAFALLLLCFLGISGAFEESVELLSISSATNPTLLAVTLPTQNLISVSSNVLEAESWLRIHVLSHYPSSRITHIAVGHNLLCSQAQSHQFGLVLPSLKNLYYSLTRWGLEKEIKVSPSISSKCFEGEESKAETLIKPLLEFIKTTNSTYLVNPSGPISKIPSQIIKFGSLDIKVIKSTKPTSRKLSSFTTMAVDPYPARPTPLPTISPSSPIHVSFPANVAKSPLPPLIGKISPPPHYFPPLIGSNSPPPMESPVISPPFGGFHLPPLQSPVISPPYGGYNLPPCIPAPTPEPGFAIGGEKLWCVAKPSVPVDTLQEAIDFACGEGGGDCNEIQPDGSCYNPDTVIAHASYAFNSYWQKSKKHGGTCSFGGTAMIINADPSFMSCKFVVT